MRTLQSMALIAVFALSACGKSKNNDPNNATEADTGLSDTGSERDSGDAPDTGTSDPDVTPVDMTAPDGGSDMGPDMGPTGFSDPAISSGTRLRARYVRGGEGANIPLGFWDTELQTACSYRTAQDTNLRCLPAINNEVYFSDSACSQPVMETNPMTCDLRWGGRFESLVYRRTDTPAVLAGLKYVQSGSNCLATSLSASSEYWVAEVVPSAEFVRGTFEDATRADNLVARTIVGDDGSRILQGAVHRTRGYECAFDENQRCVPQAQSTAGIFYSDAGCTQAVHAFYDVTPPPMVVLDNRDADACVTGRQYFETGSAFTGPNIYWINSTTGMCASRALDTSLYYFRRGAPVAVSELPLAATRLEGTDALQARRYVDSNGDPLGGADVFWDTTRDEVCVGSELPDGTLVCLPELVGYVNTFQYLDPACAIASAFGITYCEAAAPRLLAEWGARGCVERSYRTYDAVYERGAPLPPTYYHDNGSTCTIRMLSDAQRGYATGAEAASTLPTLQLLIDEP